MMGPCRPPDPPRDPRARCVMPTDPCPECVRGEITASAAASASHRAADDADAAYAAAAAHRATHGGA